MKRPMSVKEILENPLLGITKASELIIRENDFYAFNRDRAGFRLEARTLKAVKVRMYRTYFWIPRGQIVSNGNAIMISKWWADKHLKAAVMSHIHKENGRARLFKVKIRRAPSIRERLESHRKSGQG